MLTTFVKMSTSVSLKRNFESVTTTVKIRLEATFALVILQKSKVLKIEGAFKKVMIETNDKLFC